MISTFKRCVLGFALAIPASASSAQSSPSMLPEPLVSALMGGGEFRGPGTRRYFVGELPTGFPASLVPSGPVVVVGGVRTMAETIVVLADSTRRLAAVLERLFADSGYTRPAPAPGSGFSPSFGQSTYLCRDSSAVSVEPLSGPQRHFARVSYRVMRGSSYCSLFTNGSPKDQRTLHLPPLTAPADASAQGSSGGSGSDNVTSSTVLSGNSLVPSVVVAHYAAQLVKAGWRTGAPAIGARVAAQFFEATDEAGRQWQGTLMASGTNTNLHLSLDMRPRS